MRIPVPIIFALAVAGCATSGGGGPELSGTALVDTYVASAGEPVSSIRVDSSVNRWTSLDARHLAIWIGAREGYLLELGAACPDLTNAVQISLTGENRRVEAGFDAVIVRSAVTTVAPSRCTIARIRPLDISALSARRSERTRIDAVSREAVN